MDWAKKKGYLDMLPLFGMKAKFDSEDKNYASHRLCFAIMCHDKDKIEEYVNFFM